MRTTTLIATFILTSIIGLQAQVFEEESTMSEGVFNAFIIDLKDADTKMAENVWKDYIKAFGKTKKDRKSKEWRSESIIIPSIDPAYNVNLTAKIEDLNNDSRAYIWLRMDGEFINSEAYTDEARGLKVFMEDYALEVKKAIIEEELKEEDKNLKNLEKDLEKLIKKNDGFHKDIEKAKEAILKAEQAIEQNIKDQESKREEIDTQKEVVNEVQAKLTEVGKKN